MSCLKRKGYVVHPPASAPVGRRATSHRPLERPVLTAPLLCWRGTWLDGDARTWSCEQSKLAMQAAL